MLNEIRPTLSTFNIQHSWIRHDHQITSDRFHPIKTKPMRLCQPAHCFAGENRRCVGASDDDGGHEKDHLLPQPAADEFRMHAGAALDDERLDSALVEVME